MVWSGNDGPVTRAEVESALGMLSSVPPATTNGIGNIFSNGAVGQAAYGAGLLYETTGDIRALDLALKIADNMLALRNSPATGTVVWTGRRELVWPTTTLVPYAGSENGDILGHMVNAAVYILKTPCLWSMVPPTYTSTSAFASNDTYMTRALRLVDAAEETIDTYFLPWWFDSAMLMIQPNDPRYFLANDVYNLPGAPMAWNRRVLLLSSFFRLVAARETTPAFDAARVAKYDQIILANIRDFLAHLQGTFAATGQPTYLWFYRPPAINVEEAATGVHGYYDILGVWEARQRYGPSVITDDVGLRLANTFQYTISQNATFSGLVNGASTLVAPSVKYLWGGWSFYSYWLPGWFDIIATANVKQGFSGRSWIAVPLLWTKNARFMDDPVIWAGQFARGAGIVGDPSS